MRRIVPLILIFLLFIGCSHQGSEPRGPNRSERPEPMTESETTRDSLPQTNNESPSPPAPITPELLQRIHEHRLATYTTQYDPTIQNRSRNIQLSAEAIDRYVVAVGEVFSFNQVVGQRTEERGYLPAPVIVNGEYTEGVGGGICQTSSTLYNSVDRAGLRIIERVSHSKKVTYVSEGRDATVSWNGSDFKFQNQLNGPIMLTADADNGKLTVEVFASSDVRNTPRQVPDPPRKMPDTEKVPDPSKREPLNKDATWHRNVPLLLEEIEKQLGR